LVRQTPRESAPESVSLSVRDSVVVRHPPGGEWLYAKVYLLHDLHDALLVREVTTLVERMGNAVDRWFFLRYRDPWAHLRLRFHGPVDRTLPPFRDWARAAISSGLIRNVVLDTYEPETERYGGAEALPFAERLFHADSVAVVEQLALRASGKLESSIETLAAANYVELLESLGDWSWREWVLDTFPVEMSNQIPAAVRRDAVRRIEPERHQLRVAAARAYGKAIGVPAGPDRVHVPGVLSVLHMHANRLIGLDREAERRSYGLLRAAVRKHLDERRHRR
jgi:thiopeptide-type bacteriocin biosynthesis protein